MLHVPTELVVLPNIMVAPCDFNQYFFTRSNGLLGLVLLIVGGDCTLPNGC